MLVQTYRKATAELRRFQFDFSAVEEVAGGDLIASVQSITRSPDTSISDVGSLQIYKTIDASYANETVDAKMETLSDVAFQGAAGDIWYHGSPNYKYAGIKWILSTAGVGGVAAWEYSKEGGAWGALSMTPVQGDVNLLSLVNHLTFTAPTDWSKQPVNGIAAYWVRARVTTLYTTIPIGTSCQLTGTADLVIGANSNDGKKVQVVLSGGRNGTTYALKCLVRLTTGSPPAELERSGLLTVYDLHQQAP